MGRLVAKISVAQSEILASGPARPLIQTCTISLIRNQGTSWLARLVKRASPAKQAGSPLLQTGTGFCFLNILRTWHLLGLNFICHFAIWYGPYFFFFYKRSKERFLKLTCMYILWTKKWKKVLLVLTKHFKSLIYSKKTSQRLAFTSPKCHKTHHETKTTQGSHTFAWFMVKSPEYSWMWSLWDKNNSTWIYFSYKIRSTDIKLL